MSISNKPQISAVASTSSRAESTVSQESKKLKETQDPADTPSKSIIVKKGEEKEAREGSHTSGDALSLRSLGELKRESKDLEDSQESRDSLYLGRGDPQDVRSSTKHSTPQMTSSHLFSSFISARREIGLRAALARDCRKLLPLILVLLMMALIAVLVIVVSLVMKSKKNEEIKECEDPIKFDHPVESDWDKRSRKGGTQVHYTCETALGFLIKTQLTYFDAVKFCDSMGGIFFVVTSDAGREYAKDVVYGDKDFEGLCNNEALVGKNYDLQNDNNEEIYDDEDEYNEDSQRDAEDIPWDTNEVKHSPIRQLRNVEYTCEIFEYKDNDFHWIPVDSCASDNRSCFMCTINAPPKGTMVASKYSHGSQLLQEARKGKV